MANWCVLSVALSCALVLIVGQAGHNKLQVDAVELDPELFKKLDNYKLGVDEVQAMLSTVSDKSGTKLGKYSVEELLDMDNISEDKCWPDTIKSADNAARHDYDIRSNSGLHGYFYQQKEKLKAFCVSEKMHLLAQRALAKISPDSESIIDGYLTVLPKFNDNTDEATVAYLKSLPGKKDFVKHVQKRKLVASCNDILEPYNFLLDVGSRKTGDSKSRGWKPLMGKWWYIGKVCTKLNPEPEPEWMNIQMYHKRAARDYNGPGQFVGMLMVLGLGAFTIGFGGIPAIFLWKMGFFDG